MSSIRLQIFEFGKPTLHRELKRLETFKNWPCDFINPSDLAKNGFYYTKEEDIITCVYCGLNLGKWKKGDNPIKEHEQYSKSCNFINNRPCGNITISDDSSSLDEMSDETSDEKSNLFLGGKSVSEYCHLLREDCISTQMDMWGTQTHAIDIIVRPDLWQFENRLKTFDSWPKPEIQDPVKLAEAGFYYTGMNDETICFCCKGGLKDWNRTQHPWVEHAYWFYRCPFVISHMGPKFVSEAMRMHLFLKGGKITGNTPKELDENLRKWRENDPAIQRNVYVNSTSI